MLGEAFGFGGRGISRYDRFLAAGRVLMRCAPCNVPVSCRRDALERAFQREIGIGQGHTCKLKLGPRCNARGLSQRWGSHRTGKHFQSIAAEEPGTGHYGSSLIATFR